MTKRKLVAGNWKMNGRREGAGALVAGIAESLAKTPVNADVVLCPPFVLLADIGAAISGTATRLGAQDCSAREDGAFTGDISAAMLQDLGCQYVIAGHSERRDYHQESNAAIAAKIAAAHKAGLIVILCVGEKDAQMDTERRIAFVKEQLAQSLATSADENNTVIAYEPVWAIGSGLTPTREDIVNMHRVIAAALPQKMQGARVLYGGSVNAANAESILGLAEVDGALVGGASLKKDDFIRIIRAAG